ncbi:hypothetical protein [Chryseobacterium scophthalmum]|uniref:Lipoprotein n=1 Tax=Chryseobacterium scophthalmum TaxID=59733 RepID=A0A1N6I0G7_9FLAO|nr:hypothetical protein [Chryseobacterium scophthalmum]SIO25506.1 hypothetical protein SAMN05421769_3058 [Chryseobacterium scophthalmum]
MKKIIILALLIFLYSCKQQSNNEIFVSDKIYNTLIEDINKLNENNKKLNVFYVFSRQDTLIILATEKENEVFPIDRISKLGAFKYKDYKIIIAESYNPKYDIIKKKNALNNNFIKETKNNGSFDEDIQFGYIYKMISSNNIELIKKGELKEFFIK